MVNSISSKLYRAKNLFIHTKVSTVCIKEFPYTFIHLGKRLGGFKLGHQYTLEYYIARIFIENGYLEFESNEKVDSKTIQKLNYEESTKKDFGKIQDFIYIQALEHLDILDTLVKQNQIQREKYTQLMSDLNDLIRLRLAKINRLANQKTSFQLQKKLTYEENVIYQVLNEALTEWQKALTDPTKLKRKG